jgi:acetyl esterase
VNALNALNAVTDTDPARLSEHLGATHAFLSMPGVVPQAKSARAEIVEFLRAHLAE